MASFGLREMLMNTKTFIREVKLAMMTTLTLAVLLCGVYPAIVWGIAQIGFSSRANGSLVLRNGHVLGSRLIAQGFTGVQYFHPRPSAAGDGYDAANSGGSNLGPLSQKLVDQVKERVAAYRAENSIALSVKIPADAVTSSASGLGSTHQRQKCRTPVRSRRQCQRGIRSRGSKPDPQSYRWTRSWLSWRARCERF
jgi:K+-transporting ATPase KdpC subunit